MTGYVNLFLILCAILSVWVWEFRRYSLVKKFNGYGRFARQLASGHTFVNWNHPALPREFTAEWRRVMPIYDIVSSAVGAISIILLIYINS